MKISPFQSFMGTTLSLLLLMSSAQAQPGNRPGNQQNNQGNPRGNPQGGQNDERRTQRLTAMLEQLGINDQATQSAIVAFSSGQEAARGTIRTQLQELSASLRDETIGEVQVVAQLAELQSAAEKEKSRRAAAEKVLDAQIKFSENPRLEAILRVMGLIGDEAALAGNSGGGRGGGPNGGFGGPGGQNGPQNGGGFGGGQNGGGFGGGQNGGGFGGGFGGRGGDGPMGDMGGPPRGGPPQDQ